MLLHFCLSVLLSIRFSTVNIARCILQWNSSSRLDLAITSTENTRRVSVTIFQMAACLSTILLYLYVFALSVRHNCARPVCVSVCRCVVPIASCHCVNIIGIGISCHMTCFQCRLRFFRFWFFFLFFYSALISHLTFE